MNPAAKSMILKAQECLDTAKNHMHGDKDHEIAGYNLAQAAEFLLKALCAERGLEYPHDEEGHDLDALMQILEEDGLASVSSYGDIVELTPYNSLRAHIRPDERLNLNDYLTQVE